MNKNAKKLLVIFITLLVLYAIELVYIYKKSIIINVNGVNITKPQYDKAFDKNSNASGFAMLGIDINKDKKSFIYLLIKDKSVEDVIKQTLINEEIKKKQVNGDNEELKKRKLAESIAPIVVSDAEAKKYYQENLNKFNHEETVKISHIFFKKSRAEDAQKFSALLKKNPSEFENIAKTQSDDKISKSKGGELGYVARSQMSDKIAAVVFVIKPNTISEIVQTKNGYHILLVTDKKSASKDSFDTVKGQIKAVLEQQKQDKILDDLATKLKKHAKIEYINPDYKPKSIEDRFNSSKEDK